MDNARLMDMQCKADGKRCPKSAIAKGFCGNHYNQNLKRIDPVYRANQLASQERWRIKNREKLRLQGKVYKEKMRANKPIKVRDDKSKRKSDQKLPKVTKKNGLAWGRKDYTLLHYQRG